MKKSVRVILAILMLIALMIPITYSYAIEKIGGNINEKSFFVVSDLEVTKSEKIEMTINLDEIKYNKFLFELKSTENMESVEISKESENDSETLEVEKSSNEIDIEIDKETTNLNAISLYYQIPETLQVNDTIKFIATVTNMETEEKVEDEATENNNNEESRVETQTVEVEVKIVEKKEEQNENNKDENKPDEANNKNQGAELNQQDITGKLSGQSNSDNFSVQVTSTSVASMDSQKAEQTVTYNGSDNNYLSELSVSGYTLNKAFSKDNSTYFITVENDVDSLDITANEDEDSAIVCIYGNENLSEGINKILISVTAENGNVRNYRIYVTKNS